jgi:hypothetical protein
VSKQDRTTLKAYFREGALPSAENYRDLIDSTVNHVEDGFDKSPVDGLKLSSIGASLRVLSLYQGLGSRTPAWTLEHGDRPGSLHFRQAPEAASGLRVDAGSEPEPGPAGLTLTREGLAGIGQESPAWRLDVGGTARMAGRIGAPTEAIPEVPADGQWHDITLPMTGCQAFEVMAGAGGDPGRGRYALMHAIAMNAFNPRNPILNWLLGRRRIRAQTAVYGSYADRLRLRWVATPERHHFKLQIRANANYGDGKIIRYYMTRLWFDSFMQGSRGGPDRDGGGLA